MSTSRYNENFGRNVTNILVSGSRVIRGRVPAEVRAELRAAVKAGVLGHCAKDGLLPEVFFHPDHKNSAMEVRARDARYSVQCIATVMASPADVRAGIEAAGGDPLAVALNDLGL